MQAKMEAALGEFRRGQGDPLYGSVLKEALTLEKSLVALPGVKNKPAWLATCDEKWKLSTPFISWSPGQRIKGTAAFLKALQTLPNVTDVASSDTRQVTAILPTGLSLTVTLAQPTHHDFHLLQATGSTGHLETFARTIQLKVYLRGTMCPQTRGRIERGGHLSRSWTPVSACSIA